MRYRLIQAGAEAGSCSGVLVEISQGRSDAMMIKRLAMWRARQGMPAEHALRYWEDMHAPLVRRVPGVVRYAQDHCVGGPGGREPPYGGLGQVWFDSVEAAAGAVESPEWKAVIEDAASFMDMGQIVAAWAEEHELK